MRVEHSICDQLWGGGDQLIVRDRRKRAAAKTLLHWIWKLLSKTFFLLSQVLPFDHIKITFTKTTQKCISSKFSAIHRRRSEEFVELSEHLTVDDGNFDSPFCKLFSTGCARFRHGNFSWFACNIFANGTQSVSKISVKIVSLCICYQ